jgi:hypothetical protein
MFFLLIRQQIIQLYIYIYLNSVYIFKKFIIKKTEKIQKLDKNNLGH